MSSAEGLSRRGENTTDTRPPVALLAELTHRCPLACPYCSNPLDLTGRTDELSTAEWSNVFKQAAALGVLHVHLSGGEPALRQDLVELTQASTSVGLYSNLITSGIGLTGKRVLELADAGLEHVQLSLQGVTSAKADLVAGKKGSHARKMAVAEWVHAAGIPLTINAVCHRQNIGEISDMIDLAIALGARRIEIATVQFHGWAELNKGALLPTVEQASEATERVAFERNRHKGVIVIDYVPADYHATYPKACMGGWGRTGLNVTPSGRVLPCHAAETIPVLSFDNVREKSLESIWYDGAAFNAFRGEAWMKEPCRSCERKKVDFGGCRCQAMAITNDSFATDPVCSLSPLNHLLFDDHEISGNTVETAFAYRGR